MASVEKLQDKIEVLREANAELKEEVRGLRAELSAAKKALAKAVALATKMGDACTTLAEIVEVEGEGDKPKRSRKPKGEKNGGKKRSRKPKSVKLDEDSEESKRAKKAKKHDRDGEGALKKRDRDDFLKKAKKGKAVKIKTVDLDDSYED